MRMLLRVDNVTVEVECKPIKHKHLAAYPPDGRVHLSVPMNCSDEQAMD